MNIKSIRNNVSPVKFIFFSLLISTSFQLIGIYLLLQQPWIGIQTQPDIKSGFVRITDIMPYSPADQSLHLNKEQIITKLNNKNQTIILTYQGRDEYLSAANFQNLDWLIRQQKIVWEILKSSDFISITTQDNSVTSLLTKQYTPISGIPMYVWLLCLIHILLPLIGIFVWMHKPKSLESILLYFAGLSYSLFGAIFLVLYQRELTLNPELILPLTSLANASLLLLGFILGGILTYYPKKVISTKFLVVYFIVWLLLSLNYYTRWFELPYHIFILQFIILYAIMFMVSYQQWTDSKGNPINRVTLLVLHVSTQLPAGLTIILYAIPTTLGYESYITPLVAHFLMITMFIGWAIGILRFRLFEVEYWLFKILLWVLSGIAIIIIDMIIVAWLGLSLNHALGLAIIITGFIYFPIRQWLITKFIPLNKPTLQEFLSIFNGIIANSITDEDFEKSWKEILAIKFSPLNISSNSIKNKESEKKLSIITNNGFGLLVPMLVKDKYYTLNGKYSGAYLFNTNDVVITNSLFEIACITHHASQMRHQAIQEERQRIMHDLHDTVGARLLTMINRSTNLQEAQQARETLRILRDTVKLSLQSTPMDIANCLADWRNELINRTECLGIALNWQYSDTLYDLWFMPQQILDITNIFRELISNALKHAQPTSLFVDATYLNTNFILKISHNGVTTPATQWQEGTGLASLKKRINKLAGTYKVDQESNYVTTTVSLTLKPIQQEE